MDATVNMPTEIPIINMQRNQGESVMTRIRIIISSTTQEKIQIKQENYQQKLAVKGKLMVSKK